jgi:hypothetical protein
MPNYQNGKIYRIVCNLTGRQYIGSTITSLSSRLSQHKRVFNTIKTSSSRAVLEYGDYSIILIEDFPCERKEQLLARERYFIETLDCVNKNVPARTPHEWYEENKDRLIERQKIWNNNNKDKLKEYQKTFRNKNKGVYIDLTNIDLDDQENIKMNIEDIYECNELLDKEILIDLIDKNIMDKNSIL